MLDELSSLSGLTQIEIAALLGLDEIHQIESTKPQLPELTQQHVTLLIQFFIHGRSVFNQNTPALTRWLKTPHPELACPQTGFFPEWPISPPPPLEEMTSFEPFDLIAYAAQRDRQYTQQQTTAQKRAYPTPFSLLHTAEGIELVDAIFGRIEWGIFM